MTNEELIIKKLKEITGKLLAISKKIKALEETHKEVVSDWIPNKKFVSWYSGSFAESEDDVEEIEESDLVDTVQEIEEESEEEVNPELTETLEELDEAINDA